MPLLKINSLPLAFNTVYANDMRSSLPPETMIYNEDGHRLRTIQEFRGMNFNPDQIDQLVANGIYYNPDMVGKQVAIVEEEHEGGKRNTRKSKRGKTNRRKTNRRKTNRRKTNRRRI